MTALTSGEPTALSSSASIDQSSWKPEIAIVTITKDDPTGVRKTIESVEQQRCLQYEHAIVDGGSRTDIADWLRRWCDADTRRHILVTNPPKGIYPAMNAGIRRTSAPIILVLNGGDQLMPEALDRVRDHYSKHGWRWAYGGIEGIDPDGGRVGQYTFAPFSRRTFRAGLDWIPHPSAYVTRDLYSEIGLYREDLGNSADQEFFLRACLVAEPEQLPGIVSIFDMSGLSTKEGPFSREISWHRLRVASNTAFGGYSATDLAVTTLLIARQVSIIAFRKLKNPR